MNIIIVGAGGTGLNNIANLFFQFGYQNLICIDKYDSENTKKLVDKGIKTIIGHGKYEIQKEDIVIYSDAAENTKEVIDSKNMEFDFKKYHKNYSYFEFLGEISKFYKTISIAGTHGKSTSTAMCVYLAKKFCYDFGLGIVGASLNDFDNESFVIGEQNKDFLGQVINYITNNKQTYIDENLIKKFYMIVEADEFNEHFLYLDTYIAGITNIELDHVDVFKTQELYYKIFEDFTKKVNDKIFLSNEFDQEKINNKGTNIEENLINFENIRGEHNQKNGNLSTNIISYITSKDKKEIIQYLQKFGGIGRRAEYIGENKNGAKIYLDYGHHPNELNTTIEGFQNKFNNKNIKIIFQGHQSKRLIQFWEEFKNILKDKNCIVYKTYTARENEAEIISYGKKKGIKINCTKDLSTVFAKQINGFYTEKIKEYLDTYQKNDILIVFSAGDLHSKIKENI
ncbi:glutamate ligase domain-containing protein [Candidatus Vampirococcus lugosii]|uniref:UDP-N-acetylmuramate-alanine ligase (MurC) n=1 Tax=Candidatus Vampirococcus lugosii TaxID=2789015 RepID=A0ABS5QLG3_9BACT|nr:cyanophycin synthetase [Candidatus Vampirococcus lugosii]MBS8121566.1 UDP-N-acetylmuramate-alanine ligase (MurC) [Candidatus Vampirococcus lugosii]